MRPIRVLLADDHHLVRAGVRALLEKMAGIEVIGEAFNAREALALLESQRPDVVLMDLSMPGLNGIDGTVQAAKKYPSARVVILTMHSDEEHVRQALQAGAAGYLVKDAVPAELELAVRAAARGETYLSPAVAEHALMGRGEGDGAGKTARQRLTPRLREVLQLIAEGHSSKEIARILGASPKTVDNHRTRLMRCLGISDIAGLVRYAIHNGLIASGPEGGHAAHPPLTKKEILG
jgi:DNA-binding NarL/FixJ family response regulator